MKLFFIKLYKIHSGYHTNVLYYCNLYMMDRFIQILRHELDSYHIDEDDLQSNIIQICKKYDIHYQNEYKYKNGTEFCKHNGDFIITRGNKHYVLETKITYSPNWKKCPTDNIDLKNARKRLVERQCVKYTHMYYHYVKNRDSTYWDNHYLQGIIVTDCGVDIICYLNGNNIIYDKKNILFNKNKHCGIN